MTRQKDEPWRTRISVGGGACELSTNSAALLSMLQETIAVDEDPRWDLHVEVDLQSDSALGQPHFRGMGHAATACFGSGATVLFDILRRKVTARVSAVVAHDERFWRQVALPLSAGVLGAAVGVMPVHSACLCVGDAGVLVAGVSGTGKSTLALALSLQGMEFLSDDWSYCRLTRKGIQVGATGVRVKLLPEAIEHFDALAALTPGISMNGELAFEFDPASIFPVRRRSGCTARMLVFYQRSASGPASFTAVSSAEARVYLEDSVERLPEELEAAAQLRARVLSAVAELPCWRFTSPALPHQAARELLDFVRRADAAFEGAAQ